MVESRIKKSNVSFESLTAITIGVGRKKRREIAELALCVSSSLLSLISWLTTSEAIYAKKKTKKTTTTKKKNHLCLFTRLKI